MITPEQRSLDMMKTGRFGNSKGYFKIFTIFLSFLKDFFSLLYQKVVRRGGARAGGRYAIQNNYWNWFLKKTFFVKSLSSMQILEELGTRKKLDGEEWTPWKYCIFLELFYLVKIYVHQFWKFSSNETANKIKILKRNV